MNIVKLMDEAMSYLVDKWETYYTHDRLKLECFDNDKDVDVEAIIVEFRRQGFLHGGLKNNPDEFKLSAVGQIFWYRTPLDYAGRPFEYQEFVNKANESREQALRQSTIDTNNAVVSSATFQRNFGVNSLRLAVVSALFILGTFIQQCGNKTDTELSAVKGILSNQQKNLQSIETSLEKINSSILFYKNDTSMVRVFK